MIVPTVARATQIALALLEAFKPEDLDRRVMDPLGVPASLRSASRSVFDRVQALVAWAAKEQRIQDLLRIALEANRSSDQLQRVSEELGLSPATDNVLKALGAQIDLVTARQRLSEVLGQACIVDLGESRGTGFLVGPNQVMTHRTVFSSLGADVTGALGQGRVLVRFDNAPGAKPYRSEAVVQALHAVPIVVFRIDRPAGRELPVSSLAAGAAARARGWVPLVTPPTPAAGAPVIVVQPTDAGPLSVAVESDGFVGRDGDTIRYRTATAPGSTGAPCFDKDWNLIGVHASHAATLDYNEGVSIDAILRELAAAGCVWSPSEGLSPGSAPPSAHPLASLDDVLEAIDVNSGPGDDDAWELDSITGDDRWGWAEAAAVVATFTPEALVPLREADAADQVKVLLESERVGNRWEIAESLRKAALQRLAGRRELQLARSLNAGDPRDPVDALLGALIAGTPPQPAELRDPVRLRALRQVVGWLDGVVAPLPSVEDLDAALERAAVIAPFRHLTQGFFAGREPELERLTAYAETPAGTVVPRPLLVYGPGGMGKSALLAHFILAHSERDPGNPTAWRPFVYLDFDRPDLDAADTSSILIAIARQLGPQVPSVAAQARSIVEGERARRHRSQRVAAQRTAKKGIVDALSTRVDPASVAALKMQIVDLLGKVAALLGEPILVLFDTLEEVQYSNADAIEPVIDFAVALRRDVPLTRPVLAGRIEPYSDRVSAKVDLLPLAPLPQAARETLLGNQLPPELASRTGLVSRMASIVGGNPLSLHLAAEALRREENVEELADAFGDLLWKRVGDAIVQGRLYERILGHIADKKVKAIAYPGLIVRRLTWEVIRDVLAKACGLDVPDETAATDLFRRLASEVALVKQGDAVGVLELRTELRRTVLEDFRRDPGSQQTQRFIHELAVEFYAKRFEKQSQIEDRAEEVYHRLALDQDPVEIDRLWLNGIDRLLRTAVDDFGAERARAYLSNRLGLVADEDVMKTASAEEWEAWAEHRASDLVRFGAAPRALAVLDMRPGRLPTSRLHLVESVVRRSLTPPDIAGAAAAAQQAVDAARASHDASYLNEALHELVLVSRLRDDTATVLQALAELGNLGNVLGDDLVVLQAAVEGLESVGPSESQFSETAIRVFARLPDELVARAPELARRVAAQVGTEDPATLQRVLRLVGTGALTTDAAQSLKDVLQDWAVRTPDIAAFVPSPDEGVRDIASAAQYLVSNRTLDSSTSERLTGWLKSVATPRIGWQDHDL
jgi:hypothetical protein